MVYLTDWRIALSFLLLVLAIATMLYALLQRKEIADPQSVPLLRRFTQLNQRIRTDNSFPATPYDFICPFDRFPKA